MYVSFKREKYSLNVGIICILIFLFEDDRRANIFLPKRLTQKYLCAVVVYKNIMNRKIMINMYLFKKWNCVVISNFDCPVN